MSKNINASFKGLDESENEDGFDLLSSDKDLDSLSSSEGKRDCEIVFQDE